MKYVYMNERIRQKNPRKPVIVCQAPERTEEANEFELLFNGVPIGRVKYDKSGLDQCDTHKVKAWVEFVDVVEVRPAGQPARKTARAKTPNKPVEFD